MIGSSGAASSSGAGASRRPTFRSAAPSIARRTALASPRFPQARSTRRWSSCAERWTGTASSPTATIANAKPSQSHSKATPGASFVPVRIPWTLTVKDRAPRGVAAVLINPSHTYPDLALFIDAAQERLLAAIDGERSVAEILHGAGGAIGDELGRQFFRRLWEHDLIVFDASAFAMMFDAPVLAHFTMRRLVIATVASVISLSNTLVDRQYSTKGDIDRNEIAGEMLYSGANQNLRRIDAFSYLFLGISGNKDRHA